MRELLFQSDSARSRSAISARRSRVRSKTRFSSLSLA